LFRKESSRGSAPERPSNLVIRKWKSSRNWLSPLQAPTDSSRSTTQLDGPSPSPSRLSFRSASGTLHLTSANALHHDITGPSEERGKPAALSTVQQDRMTTLSEPAEYQKDGDHRKTIFTAGTHAKPYRHQLPNMPAVASTQIFLQRKTAATPATSATSAVSQLSLRSRLSWRDYPSESQPSCALESLVRSLKHSSLKDQPVDLSTTPEMKSFKR